MVAHEHSTTTRVVKVVAMYESTRHVPLLNGPPRSALSWRGIAEALNSLSATALRAFQIFKIWDSLELA